MSMTCWGHSGTSWAWVGQNLYRFCLGSKSLKRLLNYEYENSFRIETHPSGRCLGLVLRMGLDGALGLHFSQRRGAGWWLDSGPHS